MMTVGKCKIREIQICFVLVFVLWILNYFGAFTHLFEIDYSQFHYPLNEDIRAIVHDLRHHGKLNISPINVQNFTYVISNKEKCLNVKPYLLFVVKSEITNFERRAVIKKTWGAEKDGEITMKTVFLLGTRPEEAALQAKIFADHRLHGDIVQGDFVDSYFNNTLKTVMGLRWVTEHCSHARFIMFSDDDMFVSPTNVLKLLKSLSKRQLENGVYIGYRFFSAPLRHRNSKWYVSLGEYPYSMYPPYLTAGAYIMSNKTALDMYYGSLYTKHFRFDDIFLGIIAKKIGLTPVNNENFYFYKKSYSKDGYKKVIASHGFHDPEELLLVWQKHNN